MEKGGKYIHIADKDGNVLLDVPCPVGCGRCCKYWREVRELEHIAQSKPDRERCPNLRDSGCKLKRSRMPLQCKAYLCELAGLAIMGKVTVEEAQRVYDADAQTRAMDFLGKEKPKMDIFEAAEKGKIQLADREKAMLDKHYGRDVDGGQAS